MVGILLGVQAAQILEFIARLIVQFCLDRAINGIVPKCVVPTASS